MAGCVPCGGAWALAVVVLLCRTWVKSLSLLQVFNLLAELAPLMASAPRSKGGLQMREHDFSLPLTFGGVVLMVFSLFFYPRMQKRWGQIMCCRMGLTGGVLAALLVPAATLVAGSRVREQAVLFVAMGVQAISKIMSLASSTILINLAALKLAGPSQIGAVNGASQTVAAVARAIGPALGGMLYATFASSDLFAAVWWPFVACATGMLLTSILYAVCVRPPNSAS